MFNDQAVGKQAKLDQIKADVLQRHVCPDLAKTATQLVFGDGSPDAEIIFIGEAPGKKEDETGIPFVGAAGKFLDEMINSINLKRKDVYITNIVKYRPPDNRDPLPEEKKAFWPYLLKQIAIIKPKLIITLGRHSGAAFISDLHISRDHGRVIRLPAVLENKETKLTILPLYHPAAALYNGSQRQMLIDDFAKIPIILEKI